MGWSMAGPEGSSRHPPLNPSPEAEGTKKDEDRTASKYTGLITVLSGTKVSYHRFPGAVV